MNKDNLQITRLAVLLGAISISVSSISSLSIFQESIPNLSKWFDIKVEINKDTLNAVAVLTTVIFSLYTSKLFIDKIKNENIENKDKNNK